MTHTTPTSPRPRHQPQQQTYGTTPPAQHTTPHNTNSTPTPPPTQHSTAPHHNAYQSLQGSTTAGPAPGRTRAQPPGPATGGKGRTHQQRDHSAHHQGRSHQPGPIHSDRDPQGQKRVQGRTHRGRVPEPRIAAQGRERSHHFHRDDAAVLTAGAPASYPRHVRLRPDGKRSSSCGRDDSFDGDHGGAEARRAIQERDERQVKELRKTVQTRVRWECKMTRHQTAREGTARRRFACKHTNNSSPSLLTDQKAAGNLTAHLVTPLLGLGREGE